MKDAKGHGSNPRGTHSEGVDKVGMRYAVKLYPTTHDMPGFGPEHIVSTHRSLPAAGRSLGRVIRKLPSGLQKPGTSFAYLIHDRASRQFYTRTGAKSGSPLTHANATFSLPKG